MGVPVSVVLGPVSVVGDPVVDVPVVEPVCVLLVVGGVALGDEVVARASESVSVLPNLAPAQDASRGSAKSQVRKWGTSAPPVSARYRMGRSWRDVPDRPNHPTVYAAVVLE